MFSEDSAVGSVVGDGSLVSSAVTGLVVVVRGTCTCSPYTVRFRQGLGSPSTFLWNLLVVLVVDADDSCVSYLCGLIDVGEAFFVVQEER